MATKVALITGASSGIGRAAAVAFAKHGYGVSVCGRNADRLAGVTSECREANAACEVLATRADLSVESDVVALFEATRQKFGRLDVLVNNAGIIEYGSIETLTPEQYDRVMNTNLRSVYRLTQLCVPLLKESKGCIVNVSSVHGLRSPKNVLGYAVSKAGLDQFTRCVSQELAQFGVRCNSVNPGLTLTGIFKASGLTDEERDQVCERNIPFHPLGRLGQPEDVAEAILFLSDSERSSFITGVNLAVDGGRHALFPR